jgi:hypothetical protein
MKQSRHFDIIVGLFVCVLLLSNLLSSAKIIDLGVRIGGLQMIFDAGTLVFPISYIFGDILTEVYGYRRSRRVIWIGFLGMALMALFVWLAGVLPGESAWQQYAGQPAYDAILGSISGLTAASLTAYFAGEFSNSFVLAKMKIVTQGKWLPLRTIGSTIVGQGVDSIVFFVVAGAMGVFPWELIPSLVFTNYLLKVGIEVAFTPLTIPAIQALKQSEGIDIFDTETDFNPFNLRT